MTFLYHGSQTGPSVLPSLFGDVSEAHSPSSVSGFFELLNNKAARRLVILFSSSTGRARLRALDLCDGPMF